MGCNSVPQPQSFLNEPEYAIADVQLLTPQSKNVLQSPHPDCVLRQSILRCLGPVREVETEFDTVEMLAWSLKGDVNGKLPGRIVEEVLVLVKWKDVSSWEVFYLRRHPSDDGSWFPGSADWSHTSNPWRTDFSVKPMEGELTSFVRQTDFGNNEQSPYDSPLLIFLYSHSMPTFRQELATGVGAKERRRRHFAMPGWQTEFNPSSGR